jgi:hypothetical protein
MVCTEDAEVITVGFKAYLLVSIPTKIQTGDLLTMKQELPCLVR